MKKMISAIMLILLCMVCATGLAEVFAFEEEEYFVAPGKTITLKPVAQGIEERLTYKWKTEDKTIATTSKGVVTGKKSGVTNVTCTATTKSGKEYVAVAKVTVVKPVKNIIVKSKNLTLPSGALYKQELDVEPEDATFKDVEWKSSNESVAYVLENGNILAGQAGTAKVTGKAKDGSGKSVTIKVSVPTVFVTDEEVVVTDPEGCLFGYQMNASGFMTMGTSGTAFDTESVDDVENIYGKSCRISWMKIIPVKAGTGKIWFNINGRQASIKVTVKHSAVYDEVSCPPTTVKKILASDNPVSDKQFSLKGKVAKVVEQDDEIAVFVKQDDHYFVFALDKKYKKELSEGMKVAAYGKCVDITEYRTETGLVFKCPEIAEGRVEY